MHLCFSSDLEGNEQSNYLSHVYHDRRNHGARRENRSPVLTQYDLIYISTNERCTVKHQAGGRAAGLCGFDVICGFDV